MMAVMRRRVAVLPAVIAGLAFAALAPRAPAQESVLSTTPVPAAPQSQDTTPAGFASGFASGLPSGAVDNANALVMRALSLIGVRYKFGGNVPESGFDCSGFVRRVFSDALGMALPRSSYEMSRIGIEVAQRELHPGDLVFFNTLKRRFSHVGIYIGDGRFVHAPSRGKLVEIVALSDAYWTRRYDGARRIADS